jgi:hypothetical protein
VAGVSLKVGGPILASNPGSILASAEDLRELRANSPEKFAIR